MTNRRLLVKARENRLLLALVAVTLALLLLLAASPVGHGKGGPPVAQAEKTWDFEEFNVEVQVNEDASLTVQETQVVNFHGSFTFLNRDISTQGLVSEGGKTYGKVRVKDVRVMNLDGSPYDNWKTESPDGVLRVHIEFQATDEQKGWIIEYRVTGALLYYPEYDRLYWNAVSEDRNVPIKSSSVSAYLPTGTDMSEVRTDFYVNTNWPPSHSDFGVSGDTMWWKATDINPYTTITIDVAFPKKVVQVPLQYRSSFAIIIGSITGVIFLAILCLMLLLWWRKGRDMGRPELDVVRYLPPEDIRPAMVSVLVNEHVSYDLVTATIVDLAIREKLIIREEETGERFQKKRYGFTVRDRDRSDLLGYEKEVLEGLFEEGDDVTEDDLKNKFYTHLGSIFNGVTNEVMDKKLFTRDPAKVKRKYWFIGIAAIVFPPVLFWILSYRYNLAWWWLLIGGPVLAGLAIIVIGHYMPSRTKKGSELYSYAMGFQEFMDTAESEELEAMEPETFQTNLPYAMVLGVADSWAGKFVDIYTTPPDWYQGTYTSFSTVHLASSLSGFNSSVSTSLASSPSSSSSGGGGFGGGSSGGGGGGGGSSAG